MPFHADLRPRKLSLNALLTMMAFAGILSGPSLFPENPDNIVLAQDASLPKKTPGSDTAPEPLGNDPATFQARLKKVILESLARQRIPYKNFVWMAPKVVDSAILALPFSVDVGAQKIILPVYVINHRYLVTTPLLDIARHYSVVPSIPPPPADRTFAFVYGVRSRQLPIDRQEGRASPCHIVRRRAVRALQTMEQKGRGVGQKRSFHPFCLHPLPSGHDSQECPSGGLVRNVRLRGQARRVLDNP